MAIEKIPSSAKHVQSTLAQRIRMARRRAGLSQMQLATLSDVTASAVAQWEHPAGTCPGLDRLHRIARATEAPLDWLLTGERAGAAAHQKRVDSEVPAVAFDVYAQSLDEEVLLKNFRMMSLRMQSHFSALAEELSRSRRSSERQRS
jgi:transcriptional regulator with XRE-family HTH domain